MESRRFVVQETVPSSFRLADLSLAAKVTLTLFLALIGFGYLVAVANIYYQQKDADLEPGLTLDDLKRTYHGLEKEVTTDMRPMRASDMLEHVRPGGKMRKYLEKGGPPAIRTLMAWLEAGASEGTFATHGLVEAADPSPREVIARHCIRCHNAAGGEMEDVPYAATADATPEYALVAKVALPELGDVVAQRQVLTLAPTAVPELVHITHAHILSIPVFTLAVGGLFLLTGLRGTIKLILGPLPMLATCLDFSGWWLARTAEPFVYLIAAAGGLFAVTLGLQILCVFGSMWFGRRGAGATA
jgi:mono/diheme cytochrome c family protein